MTGPSTTSDPSSTEETIADPSSRSTSDPVPTTSTQVAEVPDTTSPGAESFTHEVETAIDDLAAWLDVERSSIDVVEVVAHTWPTDALGCPSTGVEYEPTPVDGYRIVLVVDGVDYTYHGALDGPPKICLFLD